MKNLNAPGGRWRRLLAIGALTVLVPGALLWRHHHRAADDAGTERAQPQSAVPRLVRSRESLPPPPPLDPTIKERAHAALAEALHRSPGLLSTTAAIPPFDAEAFRRDPKEYLVQVVPARCFQTAKPGPDATVLEAQTPKLAEIERGADTRLWVRGAPNAPVTFTAFDGGTFKENDLGSVTVQADARGLAVAHFVAGRGIVGDLNVVAGSPLAVGAQRFRLRVAEHLADNHDSQ
jgi:hypothetical protein